MTCEIIKPDINRNKHQDVLWKGIQPKKCEHGKVPSTMSYDYRSVAYPFSKTQTGSDVSITRQK